MTNELIEDEKEQLLIGCVGTGPKCYSMMKIPATTLPCDYPQARKARFDAVLLGSLTRCKAPIGRLQGDPHILSSIFSYLGDSKITCVKAKGIIMNAVNSKKVHYESMRQIAIDRTHVIENLQGPIMKRRKIGEGHCVIETCQPGEGDKKMRFTATKRIPVHPDHVHIYQPGFLLPISHIHTKAAVTLDMDCL